MSAALSAAGEPCLTSPERNCHRLPFPPYLPAAVCNSCSADNAALIRLQLSLSCLRSWFFRAAARSACRQYSDHLVIFHL